MKPQIKILTGPRAGHTSVHSSDFIGFGRHPSSEVQFDADLELEVSARHAAIVKQADGWYLQDVGSRNGTLLNGHPITTDVRLDDTDQIRLGPDGPTVEVRMVPDGTPDGVVAGVKRPAPGPAPTRPRATSGAQLKRPPGGSTTQRIRVEVGRQTRTLRTVTIALTLALVTVGAAFFIQNWRHERAREREMAAMQARTDSVLREADAAMRALQGRVEGLAEALRTSQSQVGQLQRELVSAQQSGSSGQVDDLRERLADAMQALEYMQSAAEVDYRTISTANQRAVAMIYVEAAPGEVYTGTAFAVRPDGVMITNRHVVAGEDGTRTHRQMGVRFADSDQFFRARLVTISDEVDLAVVKVDIRGGVPTIGGLNTRPDTVRQGDPVALIGFPLGTDLPMSGDGAVARTTFWAGTVSKVLGDLIQVDGYGAQGASGTPVFDRRGEVIGVLYGGQPGSGGRIVFTVPSSYVIDLIAGAG